MKKILLILLLLPILTIGQVIVQPDESTIEIQIDTTLAIQKIKIKVFDIQGKLVTDAKLLVEVDNSETDKFRVYNISYVKGVYVLHIEYSTEYLRRLIYKK
jgi:hypothetical protein